MRLSGKDKSSPTLRQSEIPVTEGMQVESGQVLCPAESNGFGHWIGVELDGLWVLS